MQSHLQGAIAVKDKDVGSRLRFFFDYLDDNDPTVTDDAYKEFGNADYKDYKDMAKDLPPETLVKWLKDPNTPAFRYGLYASMLGHSGSPKQGDVLRKMIDDPAAANRRHDAKRDAEHDRKGSPIDRRSTLRYGGVSECAS